VGLLGETFPPSWIVAALVSLMALAAVYAYLYRTRLGYATRAVMASREEAQVSGISLHRVSALAFGIGLALATLAGVLSSYMMGGVTTNMGPGITVTAFAIIVLGTLGNPLGTVAGGLIYGVALMLTETYLSSWSSLLPYVILLLVLLLKPAGLFGREVRGA